MTTPAELSPSAERIADAAQTLVQRVGYNGFSYEHISQLVGMRKASIHHHFNSKVELAVAVVRRYRVRFEEALQQIRLSTPAAPERLQAYADLFETTFRDQHHLCLCGMLGAESDSLDPAVNVEVTHFFQQNVVWLSEVIQEGISQKSLKSRHSPKELAETLLALLEGAMLVGRSLNAPMGPRRMSELFLADLQP